MKNNYYSNKPIINIFEKNKKNSKVSSQLIYGESFKILKKDKYFFKIKTNFDNYKGYIKRSKFLKKFKPNYKISSLKSRIYLRPKVNYKTNIFLPFASKVKSIKFKNGFHQIDKNKWINAKNLCSIKKKNKNLNEILNMFIGCKYKWGGKTFQGIDCSALIQIFFFFNNKFFPRDTKDQIKYKKTLKTLTFKKRSLIFWKGHVAICMNKNYLIHAYGPSKKVLKMPIYETIKVIKETSNLKIKKIFII